MHIKEAGPPASTPLGSNNIEKRQQKNRHFRSLRLAQQTSKLQSTRINLNPKKNKEKQLLTN